MLIVSATGKPMQLFKDVSQQKPKTIVLYTNAMDRHGNFVAARKVLPSLFEDERIQIRWIVKSDHPRVQEEIRALQKNQEFPRLEIINNVPLRQNNFRGATKLILPDTDLIIILPCCINEIDALHPHLVKRFPKTKILSISEYDIASDRTSPPFYPMGLGKNSLGVLVPSLSFQKGDNVAQNIKNIKELALFQFQNPFFFGYCNNTWMQVKFEALEAFIQSAIVIRNKEAKDQTEIQIVCNVPKDDIEFLAPFYKKQGIQWIEYHEGNNEPYKREIKTQKRSSSSPSASVGKTLKIFNPFPLQPQDFQTLLHSSHPFALCTGDNSLMESIFALKAVFYQVIDLKEDLGEALKEFVSEVSGKDSLYYRLVYQAIDDPQNLPSFLQAHWTKDSATTLQTQASAIAEALKAKKNFSDLFMKLVKLYCVGHEERLTLIPEVVITSSSFQAVLRDFKEEQAQILEVLQAKLPEIIKTGVELQDTIINLSKFPTEPDEEKQNPIDASCSTFEEKSHFQARAESYLPSTEVEEPLISLVFKEIEDRYPRLVQNGMQLTALFTLSNQQLSPSRRDQILVALDLKNLFKNGLELAALFGLSEHLLSASQRNLIWNSLDAEMLGKLVQVDSFGDLFDLPIQNLSALQRSQIFAAVNLNTLLQSQNWILWLFELSDQQLTPSQRSKILDVCASKIENSTLLLRFLKLSTQQLTTDHRTQIWSAIDDTVLKSFDGFNVLSIFELSEQQFPAEHRNRFWKSVDIASLLKVPYYDYDNQLLLLGLLGLPDEKFSPRQRAQLWEAVEPLLTELIQFPSRCQELFNLEPYRLSFKQRTQVWNAMEANWRMLKGGDKDRITKEIESTILSLPEEQLPEELRQKIVAGLSQDRVQEKVEPSRVNVNSGSQGSRQVFKQKTEKSSNRGSMGAALDGVAILAGACGLWPTRNKDGTKRPRGGNQISFDKGGF